MFKRKYLFLAVAASMGLTSCKKDFFDINKNPNQATESAITPDLTLAAQLNTSAARNASSYDFLGRWLGYWSASGSYSRSTVEMSYNITTDFGAGLFEGGFYTAKQYKAMETKANALGWTYYEGIAKIMGALEMVNMVDVYNNLPYSKAFDLSKNILPGYDKAEDIYKAAFAQIDAGMALIKAADVNINNKIATQDIMFGGDKAKWAKFGNTIKLKMLLHTANAGTFNAATEVAKMTDGFLGDGVGAFVQPGYTVDKPNPFFAAHIKTPSTDQESDNYNRANNFTLNLLSSLNDPRAAYFYRAPKNGGALKGTTYGGDANTANASDATSGVGYGMAKSYTSPMWVLTNVEAMFLRAEAVARGWISGDAKIAYENAVKESFNWLGVTDAATAASTYLASTNSKIAWPATPTLATMLEVIAWQKYIALNGTNMLETWNDVRRLKVVQPALSVAPERGNNPIPVRLLYPSSEYSYNANAVKGEGSINQFTSKVFWDK